ncbi:uncharacterized protein GIQ15_06970 [Arthroderma uncinatum]|uniref:uncharacterized protein n=1 Tax=Arthroderma uncinatum TaxID=74035 RepID=UPI00144AA9A2|nr:uncharacterized protein GIQ15_06970 [Arthroderma uncinatum]KAF3479994.1 hypothetical protein GIQ15_06970 [Arthroderma uncinatum]
MSAQPAYAAYARTDERMADMVTPDGHGYAEPMFNEPALEPWMDGVLDESLMAAPSSWDNFDSFDSIDSIPVGVDAALAHATPNAFDSLLADCSLPLDGQAASSSSSNFTVSPDALNISSNLPLYPTNEMAFNASSFGSFEASFDASLAAVEAAPTPARDHCQLAFEQVASAFKDLARARAAADPRPISRKQKQRDASIALYLDLRNTCNVADAVDDSASWFDPAQVPMSSQRSSSGGSSFSTSNGFSSSSSPSETFVEFYSQPQSSRSSVPSRSPATEPSRSQTQSQQPSPPAPHPGGVELVMDLNMNAATSLPRRHRPRTETQRQRYLAVRNQGACEKHKKQHKRCTCVDRTIPATTTALQTGTGPGTKLGVRPGANGVKSTSLRRSKPGTVGRASLSPTSGEDIWPALRHNGTALARNDRVGGIGNSDAGRTNVSSERLLQKQGGLDHAHAPGHDIGNSQDTGLSQSGGSYGGRNSPMPVTTSPKRTCKEGSVEVQGRLPDNSSRCPRPGCSDSTSQDRSIADYHARDHIDSVLWNTANRSLFSRDPKPATVRNSSMFLFPDGTNRTPETTELL